MDYTNITQQAQYLLDNDEDFAKGISAALWCDVALVRLRDPNFKKSEDKNFIELAEKVLAHRAGQISDVELIPATHALCIMERNQAARENEHGFLRELVKDDYDRYDEYYPELKDEVRKIVVEILGYSPDINHSLLAELSMRDILTHFGSPPGESAEILRISASFIKFREAYFIGGWELADQLPLLNFSEENVLRWLNPKPTKAESQNCK